MPLVKLDCDVCGQLIENDEEVVMVTTGISGSQIFSFFQWGSRSYKVAHKDCLDVEAEDGSQFCRRVLKSVEDSNVSSSVLDLQERVSVLEDESADFERLFERQIKINDEVLDMVNDE